jgi:hypothetical protein
VSATTTSRPTAIVPDSPHREGIADFVRWALAQLEFSWEEVDGCGKLPLAEADRAAFQGRSELTLAFAGSRPGSSATSLDPDGRFVGWLMDRLRAAGPAVHVRPCEQPTAVAEVASRLFDAYRVDGGQIHLGGCQLDDVAFLRLSFAANENGRPVVRHVFVSHDGASVPDELVTALGLLDVEPIHKYPPRIDDAALNALIASGRRIAAKNSSSRDPSATIVEPLAIAVVWVKHASGKLQFTIRETTVELPFADWASLLAAPPYLGEHSGASGFHLAATDDGRIDLVDHIASCQHSGRRVLDEELVTCSVTGKRVLVEFTDPCPVSGSPALVDQFATCSNCRQRVSKAVLEQHTCAACRQLSKIKKDDPRLVWIVGEHPGLQRWSRWQMAETEQAYIAQAESLLKRLLVVVDKHSLAVRHLATASRFSPMWAPVSIAEKQNLLG